MTLRCMIVDDSSEFLDAARVLLEREGLAVVGVASTIAQALELHTERRPDVTLIDVNLGAESGFDLAERLARGAGADHSPLVLISTQSGDDYADMIRTSPVVGFISKSELSAKAVRDLVDGTSGAD